MAGTLGMAGCIGHLGRHCTAFRPGCVDKLWIQRRLNHKYFRIASESGGEEAEKEVKYTPRSTYCRKCGSKLISAIPAGDDKLRDMCEECGYVDYWNPKMVVGCIVEHEQQVLLCKRGIEPCKGMWTVPAGFLEMNESTRDGALRETIEEANAVVEIIAPYSHLDIPVISQAYILFRAQLLPPYEFSPGPESLDTRLFDAENMPYDEIAFSAISLTLQQFMEEMKTGIFRMHHAEVEKVPGSSPYDYHSTRLKNHFIIPPPDAQL